MKPGQLAQGVFVCAAVMLCALAGKAAAQGPSVLHLASTSGALVENARPGFRVLESRFAREQLEYSRVRHAHLVARPRLDRLFHERGIAYPAAEIYVRVFKRERELEVWVRSAGDVQFQHLKTYGICGLAGKPGPKRRAGDMQVPEGFYSIEVFNPTSQFHLSLGINYPNARDIAANDSGTPLGGEIFIHGGCRSEGCLAITDGGIEDLYWLSVEARSQGQADIPVHIFPARIDNAELLRLAPIFADQPDLLEFWETLRPGYEYFEQHRRLPRVVVDGRGSYRLMRHES